MDGPQPHDSLPEAPPQGQIQDTVKAHLILMYVKDPCLNEQPVFCQAIYSECPGQSQPKRLIIRSILKITEFINLEASP